MKKLISKQVVILGIFFVLSLSPFLWHDNLSSYDFLGYADFLSSLGNYNAFNTYNSQINGGGDFSFLTSYIFLFQGFYWITSLFGIGSPVTTILLISLMILISQFSMYRYILYLFNSKFNLVNRRYNIFALFGGILYGFSPYILGIIAPGHLLQLYSYMLVPLLLMNLDQLLVHRTIKYRKLLNIYIIFFIASPSYANIGIMYVTFLIIGAYYIGTVIAQKANFLISTLKVILVYLSAFLANIWWMLPYLSTFKQAVDLNNASTVINEAVDTSVKDASMVNIFFGRAESLFFGGVGNTLYSNEIILLIFMGLLIFAFYPYFVSKKINKQYLYLLSLLLLLGAFISKGPNDPFGFVFDRMYEAIPGFQIFRRPVSKFYWFFLLIFFTLVVIGAAFAYNRSKRTVISRGIIIFLGCVSAYFIFAFIKTPLLTPFNVPNYYYDAKEYLDHSNAQKILLIPGFYGTYPTYNENANNYYGVDFIPVIWPYSFLEPNKSLYGINSPTKNEVNSILEHIRQKKTFCALTRDLGITHILIRQDINKAAETEDNPQKIVSLLTGRNEIAEEKTFGNNNNGIRILTLTTKCKGRNFLSATNGDLTYKIDSSEIIYGSVHKDSNMNSKIIMLQNENSNWKMYELASDQTFNPLLIPLRRYPEIRKSKAENGSSNIWEIPQQQKKVSFVLYYQPQLFLTIGLILFTSLNVSLISILLYHYVKRIH